MKAKRRQLVTVAALVASGVVVGLAGLLLAVLPQRSKTHDLDAQVAALQTKLISLHATSKHAPAVHASDLFALARAMPDSLDMPSIVLDLARAASSTHTTISTITPGTTPIAQTDGAQAMPLRVDVKGSWHNVTTFLRVLRLEVRTTKNKTLKVSGRLFVIDTVQMVPAPTGGVDATLTLNALSYGVPVPVVTSTDPTDTTATTTTTSTPGSVQAAGTTSGSAG